MGLVHFKVVTPASQLDAIVACIFGELSHLGQRQIGPLAGKQGDGSGHVEKLQKV